MAHESTRSRPVLRDPAEASRSLGVSIRADETPFLIGSVSTAVWTSVPPMEKEQA